MDALEYPLSCRIEFAICMLMTLQYLFTAAQTRVFFSSTASIFGCKELKLYPYKQQMITALTELHGTSRFRFARIA